MPKLTRVVPTYRKHRASGQAIVTLCGVDHYLGPHGSVASKAEYDRLISQWLAAGRRLPSAPEAQDWITVIELIAAYWKYATKYYRKNGQPTSELSILKLALKDLKRLYGQENANEFGPLKLKAIREHWIREGHVRKTINDQVGRLKRVFKWATSEELIDPSVFNALRTVGGLSVGRSDAKESTPVEPVPDDIVVQTIPHLPEVVRDMVRIQLLLGCRPGEICRIRPCDIDRTSDVWIYQPESHKTEHHGKKRTIYIGPQAQEVLKPYLLRAEDSPCFSPKATDKQVRQRREAERTTPLSCGNKRGTNRKQSPKRRPGAQYTTASYGRAIVRACAKAFPAPEGTVGKALDDWNREHRWAPNRLRHTAGTKVRRMFDIESARIVLGHSTVKTSEIYAEEDRQKGIEVARKIG